MFTNDERKQLSCDFWIAFGAYCKTLPELGSRKKKFMLYNTKMTGVDLKFDVSKDGVAVVLEINTRTPEVRLNKYEKFKTYKPIFNQICGEDKLIWDPLFVRESGQKVSRIYVKKEGIDSYERADWPQFFEFMAKEMYLLESAYKEVKSAMD